MTGLTVIGNFAVDRVDDRAPTPGGCPVFAAVAFKEMGHPGRVIARLSPGDEDLFQDVLADHDRLISPIWTERTSAFSLRYDRGERQLTVNAVSKPWTMDEVQATNIATTWVHLAPLVRGEFDSEVLRALVSAGHRVSFDGQGLVRVPRVGPLVLDDEFDRALLDSIDVLKLNREEAEALAEGPFDAGTAKRLGIAEILVTFGARGCDLYVDGFGTHVPARPIYGVQTTGTGDAFMVAYLADRADGRSPSDAAERASAVVADMLQERLETESAAGSAISEH